MAQSGVGVSGRIVGGIAGFFLAFAVSAKPVVCPALAPSDWHVGGARLESVRVLSFRAGESRDDNGALPIMAPFNEWQRGDILCQAWNMNFDAPAFIFQVDCLYTGTERYLRLDAGNVKRCLAKLHLHRKTFAFRCD